MDIYNLVWNVSLAIPISALSSHREKIRSETMNSVSRRSIVSADISVLDVVGFEKFETHQHTHTQCLVFTHCLSAIRMRG